MAISVSEIVTRGLRPGEILWGLNIDRPIYQWHRQRTAKEAEHTQKTPILTYPICIWHPISGDPFEFCQNLGIRKLESLGYHVAVSS